MSEKKAPEKREAWGKDEEWFDCDSLGDLIDNWHGSEEFEPGRIVYFGDVEDIKLNRLCNVDDILEMMGERAYDESGESADNYPDVTKEAREELSALLLAWMEKHAKPTFYRVVNVRPYTMTAEDLAAE